MSGFCSRHQGHDPLCDICTATDGIPKGLDDALEFAADWLDTYDRMGRVFMEFIARSNIDSEERVKALALIPTVASSEVQDDLRAWAHQVRSARDRPIIDALPILLSLFAKRPVGAPGQERPAPEAPLDENGMDPLS